MTRYDITVIEILMTLILIGIFTLWRELRGMRERAGLMPPKKKPLQTNYHDEWKL